MPRYDGTGPYGCGPVTGRGAGFCGRGAGFHGMHGYCHPYQRPTREQEIAELKAARQNIEEHMKAIDERLKELQTKK